MTKPRFSGPARSPYSITERLIFKNVSGETIPAYGVIKLTAFNDVGGYFDADKPDGDGVLHFVNGPVPVLDTKYGGAEIWWRALLGKTSSTTFGDIVGPVAGSWEMSPSGSGYVIFNNPVDGIAAIMKEGAGGQIVDGLVSTCIGDGWYYVELADFTGENPASPGSVDPEVGVECNACDEVDLGAIVDGISGDCESVEDAITLTRTLPTGTGVFVYAHDTESIKLKIGGHVRMMRIHTGNEGQYYAILSGQRELVKLPFPMYECCVDPVTGEQSVRMTGCTYVLVEGVKCGGGENPCPV